MMVVTDMNTGKIIEDEFGSFEDEVMNAGWLPPLPELQLALQEVPARQAPGGFDAEAFLYSVYSSQE
jgi:hypothetical protein